MKVNSNKYDYEFKEYAAVMTSLSGSFHAVWQLLDNRRLDEKYIEEIIEKMIPSIRIFLNLTEKKIVLSEATKQLDQLNKGRFTL